MIQDNHLYEGMRRFFRKLPDNYIITPNEQIELSWRPRSKNQTTNKEYFPNLERASRRAISLGPVHDVFLQVVVEPGTTPRTTDGTQLLASWSSRDRKPDDRLVGYDGNTTLTELRPLPLSAPSLVFFQSYPDGDRTYEACNYYYRSRCPERARVEEEKRRRRQDEGD